MPSPLFSSGVYPVSVAAVKQQLSIEHTEDDALLLRYIAAAVRFIEDKTQTAIVQQSYEATFDKFWFQLSLLPLPLLVVDSIKYLDTGGTERVLTDFRVNLSRGRIFPEIGQCFPCALPVADAISASYQAGRLVPFSFDNTANTLTVAGLAFADHSKVTLSSNGYLGTGLETHKTYYVVNSTGSTFQLSESHGGSAVDFSLSSTADHFIGTLSEAIVQAIHLLVGHWYNNREDSIIGVQNSRIQRGVDDLLAAERVFTV